jgi:hypothetical protein
MASPKSPLLRLTDIPNLKAKFDKILNEFNIKQTNNRFDQYERIFNKAFSAPNTKDTPELRHAIAEISDLRAIIELREVGVLSDEKLRKILPIIISGQTRRVDRVSDQPDPSRNVMFELSLLYFLHKLGHQVSYEEGNDVILNRNGESISFECKRLRLISKSSIKGNLRKAYHQLENTKDKHPLGIVVLGIEEVFEKDLVLVVQGGEAVENLLTEFNKNFIDQYGKWWQLRDQIKDPVFCPAVFVCIKANVYDIKNNVTGTGFFVTANNTSYPPSETFDKITFIQEEQAGWSEINEVIREHESNSEQNTNRVL